ncbi:MAG: hypothetical protein U1C51_07355, partial [Candidatus Izemoplasmatales bacterium]|nr:hypothetical protein [Candidatus Izemoplasmatales bacterium]
KFALAHNIKLLSFNNSILVKSIKTDSLILANHLYSLYKTKIINKDTLDNILDEIFNTGIIGGNPIYGLNDYLNSVHIIELFQNYKYQVHRFKSYLLGTTSKGHLMLFISERDFPVHLFDDNQDATCSIYYLANENEIDSTLKLVLRDLNGKYVYYSTIPNEILNEFRSEHRITGSAIQTKYNYFSPITFIINNKIYKINFNEFELHNQEVFYEYVT